MRASLLRSLLLAAAFAGVAHAGEVQLRSSVEASGAAVTLGDFFMEAGPAASRAVGPAPAAGRTAIFSARFVQAAAASAGLDWTPPPGVTSIAVAGRGAPRAGVAPTQGAAPISAPTGPAVVRRNDAILLVYTGPGVKLTTRGRALNDAAVGDPVRVLNLSSNRTVDAFATGEGAASASPSRN